MDYISTTPLYDSNYLAHYGIKGQKWGLRRYQNSDGTLTAEGAKRYGSVKEMKKAVRKEYKADNKAAKEAGATATSMRIASEIQDRVANRAVKRAMKKPSSGRLQRKANLEAAAAIQLRMLKGESERVAREHYKNLVEKYGKEAISDIETKKDGRINEKSRYSIGEKILNPFLMSNFNEANVARDLIRGQIYYELKNK